MFGIAYPLCSESRGEDTVTKQIHLVTVLGAMSMLLPRLVHAWNMFPKAKESLSESPAATAKRFYYDDLVFSPSAVRFLVESFGEKQILVGTDYPFALGESDPLGALEKAGFERNTVAAITSGNARRFLNLA